MALVDMTGQTFGRLTVVRRAENWSDGTARWTCICACGGATISAGSNLRRGAAKSCGCLQKEAVKRHVHKAHAALTTHGQSGGGATPEYMAWAGMHDRCTNPKYRSFHRYGGRGIAVCDSWRDFANFFADMGPRPPGLTLDRIDNDGNYEPGNCRWATRTVQNNNKGNNRRVTYRGLVMTLAEAIRAAQPACSPITVKTRLRRGWSIERALS